MPVRLTPRERQHLKARAHALEPSVRVGHAALTDAVVAEIDRTLTAHELVKVRVDAPDRDARAELCDTICDRVDAAEVQRVGKVLVLWRPAPDETSSGDR
jgi:putative YhbY family RNA-binding protein